MTPVRRLLAGALTALTVLALPVAAAQARDPLLMPGKQTLFQRVLARPGLVLKRAPGDGPGAAQPALTRFYVYDRREVAGTEWLEVGLTAKGKTDGWVQADMTLPWKQQLALAFTNPANRDRSLFFAQREDLAGLLEASDPAKAVAPLRSKILSGGSDPKVVAVEPDTYVDIRDKFYLLPILGVEETFSGSGHRVRLLEVASVSRNDPAASPQAGAAQSGTPAAGGALQASLLRNFSASVVFVVDTTISMGPYIERTRQAVKTIYDKIGKAGLGDQVRFGMVGFRSSLKGAPQLEYTARLFANPAEVKSGDDFMQRVAGVKEATVSSARFSEDAYAGVMTALTEVPWAQFGGRYIVLITDAGALPGKDPLSATGLDAEQVRAEAAYRGVALYTLHLKTPKGKDNHAEAEQQYRVLSQHSLLPTPLYYAVETGDVGRFGALVDTLADALTENVKAAATGQAVAGSAQTAAAGFTTASPPKAAPAKPDPAKTDPAKEDPAQRMRREAALLGHAMQLAYLGRTAGTQAPPLFKAWISDRDLAKPDVATTEVRVLLTRNQLSDMQSVLQSIAKAAEAARFEPAEFFNKMRSAAAVLGRDPNAINDPKATRLADLGLMGEYLEDLPYQSKVLQLDQETWTAWSIGQQQAFIDDVNRKLRLYQVMHDDVDRWVALDNGADPGESVYPVPLDLMP